MASRDVLKSPITLPCGRVVPNRFAKAPMVEMQAPLGGGPLSPEAFKLYQAWAEGGWGMIITGNIAIDETHLGTPFDVTFKKTISSQDMEMFKEYATVCKNGKVPTTSTTHRRPLAIVQLVHAGRQAARGSGRYPWKPSLAPSSVPMATAAGSLPWPLSSVFDWTMWGSCRAMTTAEVETLIGRFVDSAEIAHEAGFDGVELHGSHGYMLAAFLSPRTNLRTDKYGGTPRNRFRIVEEIILRIRERLPKTFVVGIKLNSADYVLGGLTEEDALQNVQWLAEMGCVDFVEISGGNYENPSFLTANFSPDEEMAKLSSPSKTDTEEELQAESIKPKKKKSSTLKREAFFTSFARRATSVLPPTSPSRPNRMVLVLTGGLRSRAGCLRALEDTGVDMCGIGRASALEPDLPLKFTDPSLEDEEAIVESPPSADHPPGIIAWVPLRLVGAGWTTLYHVAQMARIVRGLQADPGVGVGSLLRGLL